MTKKIDDFTFSYSLAKAYVVWSFRQFYSEFIILNKENVPQQGPVIFASNHLNALMDALDVLAITPFKMPVLFLARADIFGNPAVVKLLHFTKILPAYRIRDGFENLEKNNAVFQQCVEVLQRKNAIGIMPEGNQGYERKIRPIVKGVFRIAFSAQELIDEDVTIVPVGIDVGSLTKFGKHSIINVGKPMRVADYMQQYKENPAVAMNDLRADFKKNLSDLTVDFATNTYYRCFETAAAVCNFTMLQKMQLEDTTVNRFCARQKLAKMLVEKEKNEPAKVEELNKVCEEYEKLIQEEKSDSKTVEKAPSSTGKLFFQALLLLIGLPFFSAGFITNLIPFFGPAFIRKLVKIKDDGFFSSFHYAFAILFTFPVFYILNTVVFALVTSALWWIVLLFFVLQFPFGKFAYKWFTCTRIWKKQLFYKFKQNTQNIKLIRKIRNQIIDLTID